MVTLYKIENTNITPEGEVIYAELRGGSSDTKPTEYGGRKIGNGSVYIETDTHKLFFFDADDQEWKGE